MRQLLAPVLFRNTTGDLLDETKRFRSQVVNDGGVYEGLTYLEAEIRRLKIIGVYSKLSFHLTPVAYKAGVVYGMTNDGSIVPMTFSRLGGDNVATRVNAQGLIEVVPSNTPRIDWSSGRPKLLLEKASSNLFLRSAEFDNAAWLKTSGGAGNAPVVTANASVAPDGTTTAARVQFDAGGALSTDRSILSQSVSLSAVDYTQTFYIKSNTGAGTQTIAIYADANTRDTRTLTEGEWQKIEFTRTSVGGGTSWGLASQGNIEQTVDVLIWGAQLEPGSSATSHMPSGATSVTRAADVPPFVTGIPDLIGDSEGAVLLEASISNAASAGFGAVTISDGSFNNRLFIGKGTAITPVNLQVTVGGISEVNINGGNWEDDTTVRAATSYFVNDFSLWVNRSEVANDTTGSTFGDTILTRVGLDSSGIAPFYGYFDQLSLFNQSLTPSELALV